MTNHKPIAELFGSLQTDPAQRSEIEALKRAMVDALALAEIREQLPAQATDAVPTLAVDAIDRAAAADATRSYLAALRSYIEDLGGRLELRAVFPEGRIALLGLVPDGAADDRRAASVGVSPGAPAGDGG